MKTILVPTDFSKQSEYALQAAAGIAEKANALLIVLHVIEEPTGSSYTINGEYIPEGYENQRFTLLLLQKRRDQFNNLSKLDYLKNVNSKFELKVGDPFHGITSIILDYNVDLVVMGTTSHTRGEVFLGSVTNKVIRHSKCPVMTINHALVTSTYKNIVYATQMFTTEEVFTRIVRTAQNLYDGTVHLVRINTPSGFLPDHIAKKELNEFAKKHQFKNFTINVFGDVTEEEGIKHFAEEINADLIAIATHGRSGLMHLLSGSVSKEVVNHSEKPVMTFLVEH